MHCQAYCRYKNPASVFSDAGFFIAFQLRDKAVSYPSICPRAAFLSQGLPFSVLTQRMKSSFFQKFLQDRKLIRIDTRLYRSILHPLFQFVKINPGNTLDLFFLQPQFLCIDPVRQPVDENMAQFMVTEWLSVEDTLMIGKMIPDISKILCRGADSHLLPKLAEKCLLHAVSCLYMAGR